MVTFLALVLRNLARELGRPQLAALAVLGPLRAQMFLRTAGTRGSGRRGVLDPAACLALKDEVWQVLGTQRVVTHVDHEAFLRAAEAAAFQAPFVPLHGTRLMDLLDPESSPSPDSTPPGPRSHMTAAWRESAGRL